IICVTYRPDDSPLSSFEEVLKPSYIQALLLDKPITIPDDLNSTTQSLLDVILVSSNNSVRDSGVIHRPISDHSIVFVKLKVKKPKTTP
ncbi:unnamed protein product, partial [Porites lobata]